MDYQSEDTAGQPKPDWNIFIESIIDLFGDKWRKGLTTRVPPLPLICSIQQGMNSRLVKCRFPWIQSDRTCQWFFSFIFKEKKKAWDFWEPPIVQEAHMLCTWNSNRQKRVKTLLDLLFLFSGSGRGSALIERSSREQVLYRCPTKEFIELLN